MDTRPGLDWRPPDDWIRLTAIDSHTGGEPFRVIVDGLPPIPGETVLERRRHAEDHLDWLRRALMWEPRGHTDMYGGWPGSPTSPGSDLSVLFTHNAGFSTMCGHGIIALAKVVVETGMVPIDEDEPALHIDTPAGRVTAFPTLTDGTVTSTRFRNVTSFVAATDLAVQVDGWGEIVFDLAFGGAFYALVDLDQTGLTWDSASDISFAGRAIKRAITATTDIIHPLEPDLSFLYGVIFTGQARNPGNHSRNVCVFADGEVDRSPTGTGVSARLAALHARDLLEVGETITVESIIGSTFDGAIVATAEVGKMPGVVPEIRGSAHLIGRSEHWLDPGDPLGGGFLLSQVPEDTV